MKRKGLSAQQIVRLSGVDEAQFRRIRRGQIGIGAKTAQAIAPVLGEPAPFLMAISDSSGAQISTGKARLRREPDEPAPPDPTTLALMELAPADRESFLRLARRAKDSVPVVAVIRALDQILGAANIESPARKGRKL